MQYLPGVDEIREAQALKQAQKEVHEHYGVSSPDEVANTLVSCDGTWQKRAEHSHPFLEQCLSLHMKQGKVLTTMSSPSSTKGVSTGRRKIRPQTPTSIGLSACEDFCPVCTAGGLMGVSTQAVAAKPACPGKRSTCKTSPVLLCITV